MKKILVVGNDWALQDFFERNFHKYEVLPGLPMDTDLEQPVKEAKPDLIIVDVGMPGFQPGIRTSVEIRCFFDIPTILLTAWEAPQDQVRQLDMTNVENSLSDFLTVEDVDRMVQETFDRNWVMSHVLN